MALGTDFHSKIFPGGTSLKASTTGTGNCRLVVLWMNLLLHGLSPLSPYLSAGHIPMNYNMMDIGVQAPICPFYGMLLPIRLTHQVFLWIYRLTSVAYLKMDMGTC